MAYRDTHLTRLKKLIKNPRKETRNILPFIKSRFLPYYRRLLEFFKIYTLSKPFSGHKYFLPYVDFENGFFVQCGGMDGYGNDPTYYLEKALGWNGIIIEPLPVYTLCQKNRQASTVYNFAAGSFEDRDKIVPFIDCYGMSFIKGSINNEKEWIDIGEKTQRITSEIIQVPIKPVQDLIDKYFTQNEKRAIDLFVADVEGYEFNVIQGIDFEKNKPKQILLEIYDKDKLNMIKNFLNSREYIMVGKFDNHDYLFKLS